MAVDRGLRHRRRRSVEAVVVVLAALCCLALSTLAPETAAGAESTERIAQFSSEIVVSPDGSLAVRETIDDVFSGAERHGIVRDLATNFAYRPDLDLAEAAVPKGQVRVYPID
ncbi:MAG: hypothetical protein ACRC0L_12705, partial [Angustibacter sp.]